MMRKKIHFEYGCPFATGAISRTDTFTTKDWAKVTCLHCLRLRKYGYGQADRDKYSY